MRPQSYRPPLLAALWSLALLGIPLPSGGQALPEPAKTITRELVENHLRFLSSDELQGRDAFGPFIRLAEDYIAQEFARVGLKEFPPFPGYRHTFIYELRNRRDSTAPAVTYQLSNVVGWVEGTDPILKDEFILFGAHHDHLGVRGDTGDVIYNGADDNATGTVAVLALAGHFAQAKINKRSLVFATFTAEERGLIGSRQLARNLPFSGEKLVAMINFEMLGKPAADGSYALMVLGQEHSTLDEIFRASLPPDSPVTLVEPLPHQVRYYNASDNRSFDAMGHITTTLASPRSTDDPFYHRPNDHFEHLNPDYLTTAIQAVAAMVLPLVTGEVTPVKTPGGAATVPGTAWERKWSP